MNAAGERREAAGAVLERRESARPVPRRNQRYRGTGNVFSFLALMCGIASWVPLIVVITFPLTFAFFALAHLVARSGKVPGRLNGAWTGAALALMALVLQASLTGLAALPGLLSQLGS